MAYFDDIKRKRMTRQDHLREDARRGEEGFRGQKKAGPARPNEPQRRDDRAHGNHAPLPAGSKADRDAREFFNSRKPGAPQRRPEPARKPEFVRKPEPKPAPAPHPVAPPPPPEAPENLLTGRNPIREALRSGHDIEKLLVAKGDLSATAREIVAMAREARVPVQMVERIRLDELARNHQGMIAFASAYRYAEVDDMLRDAEMRGEAPFLVILDGVTDPHNLGAVIRTAVAVGAHGVIVPERRAVGLTPAAVKASAGGVEHIRVARVTNLTNEIKRLKRLGVWIFAADMHGEDYRTVDLSGPCALVIGSEGEGISRLVLEQCDHIVSLPMRNPAMESLNASVAAGVLLYAAAAMRK